MTDAQINVAVAGACGWKSIRRMLHTEVPIGSQPGRPEHELVLVPNYCRDLNAMEEARATLIEKSNRDAYCFALAKITHGLVAKHGFESMDVAAWKFTCATAMQEAEAFLRVKLLWKD